jgi:galactokinase
MNIQLAYSIKNAFINKFEKEPLLVFSPGRINLIGEHTDYNEGFVFPAAIDKGIIAALGKSNSNFSTAVAIDINEAFKFDLKNMQFIKNGGWKNYVIGVVAEIQKTGRIVGNFDLVFGGDIPIGSGLSSSAALENSVVFGLNSLFNFGLTKKEMIFISQKAEHNYVGVNCGIMDQYASMFGQKNSAILLDCQNLKAKLIQLDLKDYDFLLINTNVKHSLAESAYNERYESCKRIAAILRVNSLRDASEHDLNSIKDQISEEDFQKALYVIQENRRVLDASGAIIKGDLKSLGRLLFDSHHGLRYQYKVSCDELDFLVDTMKNNSDVIGSRMMGGGFGGCTINLVRKDRLQNLQKEVGLAYKEKFGLECDFYNVHLSEGTHLMRS